MAQFWVTVHFFVSCENSSFRCESRADVLISASWLPSIFAVAIELDPQFA